MSYFGIQELRYTPNTTSPQPSFGHAPFGSTAKLGRSNVSSRVKKNQENQGASPIIQPFGSQYDQLVGQLSSVLPKQDCSKSSFFASKSDRFEAGVKKKDDCPGPGQYDISSSSPSTKLFKKFSQSTFKKKGTLPAAAHVRAYSTMSTSQVIMKVPSIPSDHLGYRYDDNNVMEKVKEEESLGASPGSYQIRTDLSKTSMQGVKWKSDKPRIKAKAKEQTPAPGDYQYELKSSEKTPISSFKSKTQRFSLLNEKKLAKPGPGSYNLFLTQKKSHYNYLQGGNFNSKAARFDMIDKSGGVGPGQYFNPIKQRLKVKSQSVCSLGSKSKNIRSAHQQQSSQTIAHKKTIFDVKNNNPGPGEYANTTGMTFKLQKDLFRKFSETTLPKEKRSLCQSTKIQTNSGSGPGPGQYYQSQQAFTQKKSKQSITLSSKIYKKSQTINLKNLQDQETPSPFQHANYSNTIQSKLQKHFSKLTLADPKPFGFGQERFKHYKNSSQHHEQPNRQLSQRMNGTMLLSQNFNDQADIERNCNNTERDNILNGSDNKKVRKLIMTNSRIMVPFGSSSIKMSKTQKIGQSPGKFYQNHGSMIKKSHNVRSKK